MLDIVTQVLGFATVSLALRHKQDARAFLLKHPNLVKQQSLTLLDNWQNGTPRQFLESLDEDLRNCLICCLVYNIADESIADFEQWV